MALVGTWSFGWGLFRIVRDELFILGPVSMLFGAALLALVLVSQNRGEMRSTRTEGEDNANRPPGP